MFTHFVVKYDKKFFFFFYSALQVSSKTSFIFTVAPLLPIMIVTFSFFMMYLVSFVATHV